MSSSERTLSVKAKIERAHEHIRDLNRQVEAFHSGNPYRAIVENDLKTSDRVIKLRICEPCPSRLLTVLGDAIHNLRSSLDHLMWQLVLANGRTPNKNTFFPIHDTKVAFDNARKQREQEIGIQATDLLNELKPYAGGNDMFWSLHHLDIIDKHRFLITTVASNVGVSVYSGVPLPIEFFFPDSTSAVRTFPTSDAVGDGTVLFRMPLSHMKNATYVDPEFSFHIAFGEVCERQPLVGVLMRMSQAVQGTVQLFEAILG